MAQDKKGIIVYSDWIKKFEAITDEEAGKLIKHFFRYVNDLNPKAPDRITELLFIDIEQSLKRDLVKWEQRAERSRNNGQKGGRPPKEENPEKPEETQQVIEEPEKPVSVSDTVNGSDIKKEYKDESLSEFDMFVGAFNKLSDRSFRGTKKAKASYHARLKEKYSKTDIWLACKNAHLDKFHIENSFTHLTPEYILREDILNKYLNIKNGSSSQQQMTYTPVSNKIDHSNLEA